MKDMIYDVHVSPKKNHLFINPQFNIRTFSYIHIFIAIFLDNYVQGKRRKEVYGTHVKHQP